jgi:transcription-repair coupling factor (superfamily II helicase)
MFSWHQLSEGARESPSLKRLCDALRKGESLLLEGLWDLPKSLVAALISQELKRPVIVLTSGVEEDRLYENLDQLIPGGLLELPAWDTIPGEEMEPAIDLIGKRFEVLKALRDRTGTLVLLCPISALLQPVVAKDRISSLTQVWKKGDKRSFMDIPALLTELGYQRASLVQDKGQFAVRGGIIDLFPSSASDPYRVEWVGDEIASLRTFDPSGQKSIGRAEELFLAPARERKLAHASLLSYFSKEPIFFWEDLLGAEERLVALHAKGIPDGQHLICAQQPMEMLFPSGSVELFHKPIGATRFIHNFRRADPDAGSKRLIAVGATETEEKQLREQLSLPSHAQFERGRITEGFTLQDASLSVISYADIAPVQRLRRQRWRGVHHGAASEFQEFAVGDLVVHYHSGIGRYMGREAQKNHLGVESEFIVIEFAEKSRLFVPISQVHLVSRYVGVKEETPPLSQLGGKRWQAARQQAQTQIVGYAHELLKLYAERSVGGGFSYPEDGGMMQRFERDFPYTETADQRTAILALKKDMISDRPMDRLICGDVGYGKTEVAMRAAFKAVADGGKQVAVLVPTTVLALQHFETFVGRMAPFAVRVEVMSRFRTARQMKETVERIAAGQVDIVIGTHRILSKDVVFKDLGLVIIDEEQRFGVKAKEHLKRFCTGVDSLTLSATPIPRTLYMSLVHVRDVSTIQTPPQDRLPVKTIIAEGDQEMIENALLREMARGGQSFYIHNRVDTIGHRSDQIGKWVPTARRATVHGQMDPEEVDATFHKFKSGEIDILFSTTLVENGVDVPNANTILIDRADTYGLADLYQLRGRVGRWNRAAYAYFLIPKGTTLTDVAKRRLHALAEAGGYGGGMRIAMRDLEIRGAGDILGVQQSGQASAIGFQLYCKMLQKAVDALKLQQPISFHEVKMEFSYDARIPDQYLSDFSLRMEIYSRFGDASSLETLDMLLKELIDRFGKPPQPVLWLYHLSRIRVRASLRGIAWVRFSPPQLSIDKVSVNLPKIELPEELEEFFEKKLQYYEKVRKGVIS